MISSDGTKAYVSNFSANTVTVLNLSPTPLPLPTVAATITGFNQPSNLAITPDANTIYVSDPANNRMAILNTTINTITGQITQASANLQLPAGVPFFPGGFVVTPDQAPTAQFTSTSSLLASVNAAASFQVTFDASGSSSPVGTIVSYAWDFGDGTTAITSNPIITHTYSQAGFYTVTLTVTNSAGTSTTQIFTGRTVSNNGGPSASLINRIQVGPILTQFFSPAIIRSGGTSMLTIILNFAGGGALSSSFTDTLPSGLFIAGLNTATTTCGGTNVISNTLTAITLASGATIPSSGSCMINATVTSSIPGIFDNTIPVGDLIINGSTTPLAVSARLFVRGACTFCDNSCL